MLKVGDKLSYHIKQLNDLITAMCRCRVGGATYDDESLPLKPFSFHRVCVAFTPMKPHFLYGKQDENKECF